MKRLLRNLLTAAVLITAFLSFTCVTQAQNVGDTIAEFGFEQGADSAGVPLGLTMDDWNGTAQFLADNVGMHSGGYSGSIKAADDTSDVDANYNVHLSNLQTGATYTVSLWMKTEITEGAADVHINWTGALFDAIGGSTEWTEYVIEIQYASGATEADLNMRLYGKGQVWFDDIKVTKTGEVDLSIKNPGFELPNADGTGPDVWFGHLEGGWSAREDNYVWDDTEAHSGNYSAKFQLSEQDTSSFYTAWRQDYPFIDNTLYQIGCWVKIKQPNTDGSCTFQINTGHDNKNYASISPVADTNWVFVQDTILFPIVDNYWRNQLRFRFRGNGYPADGLPECWIDDVVVENLGSAPSAPQNIMAVRGENNTVTVTFEADVAVQNPIYHILMQPTEYDTSKNKLINGGFEKPNDAGDGPKGWNTKALNPPDHPDFDMALLQWPAEDTDPYEGDFCVKVQSENPASEKGACAGWHFWAYDGGAMKNNEAYIYTVMTKYKDVISRSGKVENIWSDVSDSLWTSGVTWRIMWADDAWFNWAKDNENHPAEFGYDCLVGTSDEWVELRMPITSYGGNMTDRFWCGLGLGHWPSMGASGEVWYDNAGIYPFEEVATSNTNTVTLEDVPEGVEYIAVWTEASSLGPALGSSMAIISKITAPTSVANENIGMPKRFTLEQNFPNPFNPSTSIEYYLPNNERVTLTIYNMLGQQVDLAIDNVKKVAGKHSFYFDASKLSSGVYFYQIKAGKKVLTKKMLLMK